MKHIAGILMVLFLASTAVIFIGCEEKEADDLAKAQKCLDDISGSLTGAPLTAAAQACFDIVAGYDSQQANIIKCSAKYLGGGLTTQKLAIAYEKLTTTALANKEAVFMSALAMNPPSAATEGKPYCDRSGVRGLIYLANLAIIGTTMQGFMPGFDPDALGTGGPTDLDAADISSLLTACQPPADCGGATYSAIGTAAVELADTYCVAGNENVEACAQFNQAVAGAGGDPALTAKHLFCLLDGKTFDGVSCN